MSFEVVETNHNINDMVGIVSDQTIRLTGTVTAKKYPEDLRLVMFHDTVNDEVISFITNNMELGPLVIANIYRNRWAIETFFKWIKGNLTIKSLWGYSENTVKIHPWVAISSYLLLAWGEGCPQKPPYHHGGRQGHRRSHPFQGRFEDDLGCAGTAHSKSRCQ